jgi:hypothetical protein
MVKLRSGEAGHGTMISILTRAAQPPRPSHHCDDPDRAAKIIRDALGIESDDVVNNYCFPKEWPANREQRARYIGEWLKTEVRYLAS